MLLKLSRELFRSAPKKDVRTLRSLQGSFVGYQIYYDNFSESFLDPAFNPVFNERATPFLENQVIADLIDQGAHQGAAYFGVFSWKAGLKLGLKGEEIFGLMRRHGFKSDIYTFPFETPVFNVWTPRKLREARKAQIAQKILAKMGIDVDLLTLPTPMIYQNHFVCRSEVYEQYYEEMLKPAMQIMSDPSDVELQAALFENAPYPVENRVADRVQDIFGRGSYTMHPFICERLFATWIALKGPANRPSIWIPPHLPSVVAMSCGC